MTKTINTDYILKISRSTTGGSYDFAIGFRFMTLGQVRVFLKENMWYFTQYLKIEVTENRHELETTTGVITAVQSNVTDQL